MIEWSLTQLQPRHWLFNLCRYLVFPIISAERESYAVERYDVQLHFHR